MGAPLFRCGGRSVARPADRFTRGPRPARAVPGPLIARAVTAALMAAAAESAWTSPRWAASMGGSFFGPGKKVKKSCAYNQDQPSFKSARFFEFFRRWLHTIELHPFNAEKTFSPLPALRFGRTLRVDLNLISSYLFRKSSHVVIL